MNNNNNGYKTFTFENDFKIGVKTRVKNSDNQTSKIDEAPIIEVRKVKINSQSTQLPARPIVPEKNSAPPPEIVVPINIAPRAPPPIPPRSLKPTNHHTTAKPVSSTKPSPASIPTEMTAEDWKIFRQHLFPIAKKRELFTCPICQRSVDAENETFLLACKHRFCQLCLVDEIETRFNFEGQARCPMRGKCKEFMQDEEVQKILGERYRAFVDKIIKMLKNEAEMVKHEKHLADEKEIEEMVYVPNKVQFECKICYCDAEPGEGVTIKSCRHNFCKDCLTEYVKSSDDIEIKCPFNGEEGNCNKILTEREMRGFLPTEVFDKHLLKSLTLYETTSKTFHCLKADCTGFVEADKNVRGFMCQVCSEVNCIQCEAIHTNKTCVEYQDIVNPDGRRKRLSQEADETFKAFVAEGKAMYCPQCRLAIVKDEGCDFLQCPTCRLGICWVTKKPRMPLHKQDGSVIDGCHCRERRVNGVEIMCHPNCKFCH